VKIILTDEERDHAPWYRRELSDIGGCLGCFGCFGSLALVLILGAYLLTAISLKIYLAAVVVILLMILLRFSSKGAD
jgi:hypothetical protein